MDKQEAMSLQKLSGIRMKREKVSRIECIAAHHIVAVNTEVSHKQAFYGRSIE